MPLKRKILNRSIYDLIIAPYNAIDRFKERADIVLPGNADQEIINSALEELIVDEDTLSAPSKIYMGGGI